MTTIVNITLIQEGNKISVRSDSVGQDEQVLALGLQLIGHLSYLELSNSLLTVEMPTLSSGTH